MPINDVINVNTKAITPKLSLIRFFMIPFTYRIVPFLHLKRLKLTILLEAFYKTAQHKL